MPRGLGRAIALPLIEIAVEPRNAGERAKLAAAFAGLSREDTTFSVTSDAESRQIVLGGQSEEHLDALVTRLKHDFGIGLAIGAPQIAYRETIGQAWDVAYTHKKQFQGRGAFARVKLRLEPGPVGSGVVLHRLPGLDVGFPPFFLTGTERGIRTALAAGLQAGFPVTDLAVTIVDGAYHDTDSTEDAFAIAARAGVREGLQRAGSLLLEPVMDLVVTVPPDYAGSVLGDLASRRGVVDSRDHDDAGGLSSIRAHVPLSNLFGYRNQLNGFTRGSGIFAMSFREYAPVPRIEPPDDPRFPPAMAMRA